MKSLLTILIFFPLLASAQALPGDSVKRENRVQLPPLADLIDSAIKHNASVKFRQLDIDAKAASLRSEQNYWIRNMGFQADSRYGTFDNYSSNVNGQSTSIFTTTSKQFNYGAGFYIKFPLVDLLDRKNQVNRARAELEQAKTMETAQADEVRQLVIRAYQDLLLKQRLLDIRSKALGNAKVNMDMVEKQFRNGTVVVVEYVRISDIVSRVESEYETAKSEFSTAKMILEDITGLKFTTASIIVNEND